MINTNMGEVQLYRQQGELANILANMRNILAISSVNANTLFGLTGAYLCQMEDRIIGPLAMNRSRVNTPPSCEQ